MKSILASVLLVFSVHAKASIPVRAAVQEPEFCKLMASANGDEDTFFDTISIDVLKTKSLSAFRLSLVQEYLSYQYPESASYTQKTAGLKGIQAFFAAEQSYNELYLKLRKSKETGAFHIEVVSYPGDNAAGTVYDAKTGAVIGHNGDDSYTYFNGQKEGYCQYSN